MDLPDKLPDYQSNVFATCRHACARNWQAYTDHAFVRGLADGSLPRAAFMHYLVQDYLFLVHFSRAWALAVVKADTIEEMRVAAGTVNALVNEEMQLHVATCEAAGISEAQLFEATEETETVAYTRYVLDAGLAGDFLDMLMTLAPCVFGYGHIGLNLARQPVTGNPYQEWIDMYGGQAYQEVCETAGGLLQSACERRLGTDPSATPRWPGLIKRFDTATRLEVGFWDMGLAVQR